MRSQHKSLLAAAALLLGLAACDSADDRTVAMHESAKARTMPAAKESREPARETSQEKRHAAAGADAPADHAANDTRAMGAAPADRGRDPGAVAARTIDDASLTAQVSAALASDKELRAMRVDVDTRDRVVTLSGPAPTASAKERAAEVAHKVQGVESVNNQITIKGG